MTLQEILQSHDLTAEVIAAIMAEMKENKIFTSTEENLDIRYKKLKEDHDSLTAKHEESAKLIEELKNASGNTEELSGKLSEYEARIEEMQAKLDAQRLEFAIKEVLTEAMAKDVDYMTYKLKENTLALGDDGKIIGITEMIDGLKERYPDHFASSAVEIDVQRLEEPNNEGNVLTKEEFLKKPYKERAEFANENPEAYSEMMGQ